MSLVSLVIALLMTAVSIAGLAGDIYPTEELRLAFVPNDVVNLVIGLPILLGSIWSARRGQLIGRVFWPGALLYVVYTYLVYLFAMPVSLLFLAYLVLVMLSIYTLAALLSGIESNAVQQRLCGAVPERFAAGVLVVMGSFILLRVVGVIVQVPDSPEALPITEQALLIADFLLAPAWIIGGVLLWQRQPFAYVIGPGLLFQASMLYIGLIMVLILQPLMTDSVFLVADVVVVLIMGMVCFVPFALFIRGMRSKPDRLIQTS